MSFLQPLTDLVNSVISTTAQTLRNNIPEPHALNIETDKQKEKKNETPNHWQQIQVETKDHPPTLQPLQKRISQPDDNVNHGDDINNTLTDKTFRLYLNNINGIKPCNSWAKWNTGTAKNAS